ncbi:MAG: phosphotyrosine protein phosphatase [Candidatus Woesearchaeota archaeon]
MKVLFVCNQNQHRSKTAEEIFKNMFETKSAGLYNENPISSEEIEWADVVAVMDDDQRSEIAKRFPLLYMKKRILVLNVPDMFYYMQPELVELLKKQAGKIKH